MSLRRIATVALCFCAFSASGSAVAQGSIELFLNATGSSNQDHGLLTDLPDGFGDGEFTLEMWLRPNNSFPVGSVIGGVEQRTNWAQDDNAPYSSGNWWFKGNFLLDGHNNNSGFSLGTFSLQFYAGGRVRWLFGDGSGSIPTGSLWAVGGNSGTSPSLLDGQWHQLTWCAASAAAVPISRCGSTAHSSTLKPATSKPTWQAHIGIIGPDLVARRMAGSLARKNKRRSACSRSTKTTKA